MASRQPSQRALTSQAPQWVAYGEMGQQYKAVSLGSGTPDDPIPQFMADILRDIAEHPERTDFHQYTRAFGHPRLVNILAKMYSDFYGREVDAYKEILTAAGGYFALYYIFMGWIGPGDEVLVLEPAYDCYMNQIKGVGGKAVSVPLRLKENATSSADFQLDMDLLEAKYTEKCKILVLINPGNPTGKMYTAEELNKIAEFAKRKDLIVIADEVYEYHVLGDKQMIRFASLPDMFERTISIGSAGKALSITGWRVGWMIGPDRLLEPARLVHFRTIFTSPTLTQEATARAFEIEYNLMKTNPSASYLLSTVPREMTVKRNKMVVEMQDAGFRVIIPDAGYFVVADIANKVGPFSYPSALDTDTLMDARFCRWLVKTKRLLCLPVTCFYSQESRAGRDSLIRVCYVKNDATIAKSGSIFKTV